ncbi:tetratricopeptide repeat protein [Thermomonas sp. HDW16]|uniref:tetratricopeptide repeat protein n=1 Tax=Thermomonas sp. HDW16 TaxID=2714945 RepID=UPI001408681B|nr:tetratricopeptide repeat protein [Thermomonas sp. HDW16]QIL20757.1 tetratricopeptide repeat protein [Thermomonas sp. HDW16]
MTVFIGIATVLTLLVLVGVLWPLWHSSRRLFLALLTTMGIGTALLYQWVGTPAAINVAPPSREAAAANAMPANLDEAVGQLETELKQHPDQPEGWRLLGRSYMSMGRYLDARRAFETALNLQADDPDLLVETVQARMYTDPQRRMDADAVKLLQRALQLQPQHQRARWFLGVSQRQQGQAAEAAKTWEPLLAQVDAATAASLRKEIDAARIEAGMPALPAVADAAPAVASANALQVKVSLDPAFAAKVRLDGNAQVFVIARQPAGPPMPVAVEKRSVTELPFTATLDDADSPMPTLKLSQMPEVELVARLSSSGIANKQDGDIESKPVRVALPAKGPVELVIGTE